MRRVENGKPRLAPKYGANLGHLANLGACSGAKPRRSGLRAVFGAPKLCYFALACQIAKDAPVGSRKMLNQPVPGTS